MSFRIFCDKIGSTYKTLLLLKKYDGCFEEKHLYDWVLSQTSSFFFFMEYYFYLKEQKQKIYGYADRHFTHIFFKMDEVISWQLTKSICYKWWNFVLSSEN